MNETRCAVCKSPIMPDGADWVHIEGIPIGGSDHFAVPDHAATPEAAGDCPRVKQGADGSAYCGLAEETVRALQTERDAAIARAEKAEAAFADEREHAEWLQGECSTVIEWVMNRNAKLHRAARLVASLKRDYALALDALRLARPVVEDACFFATGDLDSLTWNDEFRETLRHNRTALTAIDAAIGDDNGQ